MTADVQSKTRSGAPFKLLAPVSLATAINGLNSSMIAVGLLSINRDLGPGANITWLVTAFYLAAAVAQPIAGRLIDQFGARSILLWGLALVAAGSASVYGATTIEMLVALRVVIGIGAAAGYPASMAILRNWEEGNGVKQGVGGVRTVIFSAQGTVMLAPAIGGIVIGFWDWRAMFFINVPLSLLTAFLVLLGVPSGKAERRAATPTSLQVDWLGFILFATALVPLLIGLNVVGQGFWWLWLIMGLLGSVIFVRHQRSRKAPFIDFRLLVRNRGIGAPIVRQFVVMAILYAILFGFPTWLEGAQGLTPGSAGLVMLPISGMGLVATVLAGPTIVKWGIRAPILIGAVLMTAAMVALLFLTQDSTLTMVIVAAFLLGVPNGFFMLGNQMALFRATPTELVGVTTGLLRTSQFIGGTMAMLLLGFTFQGDSPDSGLHSLALVLGSLSLLVFIEAALSKELRSSTGTPQARPVKNV